MNWIYKLYAMWIVPNLEREIEQIDKDIALRTKLSGFADDEDAPKLKIEIYNLEVAKAYITHKCDRIGGWL